MHAVHGLLESINVLEWGMATSAIWGTALTAPTSDTPSLSTSSTYLVCCTNGPYKLTHTDHVQDVHVYTWALLFWEVDEMIVESVESDGSEEEKGVNDIDD